MIALYHRYLGSRPYRLLYTNSGAGAINEVARYQEEINLVLLDINLPDLDGWDVLKVIRENPGTRHLPVVICSVENDAEKAADLGAQAVLPKPITEDDLLTAVNQYLTTKR
jgi:CheY-like chemotaxis protein